MTIEIKLGKYTKNVLLNADLATCLEFTLVWADLADNPAGLVRMCSAAIGVILDADSMLPKYRADKDSILKYGRKVLERLLEKNVPVQDIYNSGSAVLIAMSEKVPNQQVVEDTKDFFPSQEEED